MNVEIVPVIGRFANLGTGGLAIAGGISQFFPISFQAVVIAVYLILFGAGIIAIEVGVATPYSAVVYRYASFLYSYLGRGIFYIFIGTICLHGHVLRIILGSTIGVIGLFFVVLNFIPGAERPPSMKLENEYEAASDVL